MAIVYTVKQNKNTRKKVFPNMNIKGGGGVDKVKHATSYEGYVCEMNTLPIGKKTPSPCGPVQMDVPLNR
jgi:hypothetical protein